jgi:hypothetical protein
MAISKPDYQLQLPLSLEEAEGALTAPAAPLSAEEVRLRSETARQLFDEQAFPWMEEYRKLREGGWDWRVAAYIAWASSPKGTRQPKSQDELARTHLGLMSDRAISTWRRKNPAIDEMVAVLQSAPLWEHRADVYEALIEMAKGHDYKSHNDRKLFLELIGDYLPASKLEAILKGSVKGGDVDTEDEDVLAAIERKGREMAPPPAPPPIADDRRDLEREEE